MFTGLIEHLGTVVDVERDNGGCALVIGHSTEILDDCTIGDSIAVNGACLTVTEFSADKEDRGGWFKVWLANETLERTDFREIKVNGQVNLERAMSGKSRFGGHYVQAHVDGTAILTSRDVDGDSLRLVFKFPPMVIGKPTLMRFIVEKGYVTIDGASLTITEVDDFHRTFGVMLIQHTQSKITLGKKEVGELVNVEVDMIGKYVEKSVHAALTAGGTSGTRQLLEKIVEDIIRKNGTGGGAQPESRPSA